MGLVRSALRPLAVAGLLRELRAAAGADKPLVVGGARELAQALRRELARGGVEGAIRLGGDPDGAAALVYVLAGDPTEEDEAALRAAERAGVPVVCLLAGPASVRDVPYVPATEVVRAEPGQGFPTEALARALARRLGEAATPLAARLPVLREAVCNELIRRFSRTNALVGAAVFIPGADLPVLTLNELRLVLRIADAHGYEIDAGRLPEVLATLGAGFGFRAVAREALAVVPIAGWAVKGAVAYGGTRALGEAAVRYFAARTPVRRIEGERLEL
jgi:uncharacterized protein (DUF697 family)